MGQRSRDNGEERAVHGPLASPLGPGARRVSSGGGFWLRTVSSPDVIPGRGARVLGPYSPCCVCSAGTWTSYGGQPYCTPHAIDAAKRSA